MFVAVYFLYIVKINSELGQEYYNAMCAAVNFAFVNRQMIAHWTRDVFKKTYLKDFDLVETYYSKGPVPMLGRLNFIPGVNFPAKNRILPRSEAFSDRVCFFLKKK